MFGKRFQLNDEMLPIVEEIGSHMPGGFFIYQASGDETLLYINRAAMEIYGCADLDEFKEHTGYSFKGMVYPDDYDAISSSIDEQIGSKEDKIDYVEYRIVRKDGSVRWVDDYGHYTDTDAYGGIYYVFISDITEKKEQAAARERQAELEHQLMMQEKMLEQEKQRAELNSMITAMASDYRSVYHVDLDANDAVCYRTDPDDPWKMPEGVHFPFHERFLEYCELFVDPDYRDEFIEFIDPDNIRRDLSNENIIAYRYLARRGESEYYEMLRMAGVRHPADRDDNMVHAVGVGFTEIDKEMRESIDRNRALREALAAAEQASKAKTTFLSNMSHEIRTPMNAIIGLNKIALENPELPDETREQLVKIGDAAQHLLSIINDILDMSRIESGRMTFNAEEFSLDELLEQVNVLIGSQCREEGLTYEFITKGKTGGRYSGDEMKLKQILINILGNSVKFTPEGGKVTLKVEERKRLGGNATFRFVMSDTGIGMSKDYLPKIFDAFSQENSAASSSGKFGSTGLGMPITKSFVELMNGRIEVDSEKGVGTTFVVTLTLKECEDADRQEDDGHGKDAGAADGGLDLSGRRILLAEDMTVNAEIMMMVLGMQGMEAEHAENGQQAVDMYLASEPGYYDAVLMDMRMPVMGGLDAARAIRASGRADAETIPIIALTANAFDEDVQRSMQAGLNAHLSKPVEPATIFATLEKLIGSRMPEETDHGE